MNNDTSLCASRDWGSSHTFMSQWMSFTVRRMKSGEGGEGGEGGDGGDGGEGGEGEEGGEGGEGGEEGEEELTTLSCLCLCHHCDDLPVVKMVMAMLNADRGGLGEIGGTVTVYCNQSSSDSVGTYGNSGGVTDKYIND